MGQRTLKKDITMTAAAGKERKVAENDLMDPVEPDLAQFFINYIQVEEPFASNDLDPNIVSAGIVSPYPSSSQSGNIP